MPSPKKISKAVTKVSSSPAQKGAKPAKVAPKTASTTKTKAKVTPVSKKPVAVSKTPRKPSPAPVAPKKSRATVSSPKEVKKTVIESTPVATEATLMSAVLANSNLHIRMATSASEEHDDGADPGHLPNDEVLDEADQAQHLQLQELAAINRRARELNKPETHEDFDGAHCVECDTVIPPARLLLQKVRCVDCQSFLEEDAKRRQRTLA